MLFGDEDGNASEDAPGTVEGERGVDVGMSNDSTDHVLRASSAGTNQLLGHDNMLLGQSIE